MFELKPIVRQVLLACGGLAGAMAAATPASAQQQAQVQQQQQLERVTITGTNIRRTDTETVTPVQIITRDEIEKTGKPTVAEVLRSIPGNTGGSFDESFSNSFAPGASGISLRALGQKTTLVLINGRRVAGYGFAQNISDTFVDLNAIPSSAVERIEVLKDGASAIYGSDAIAGVVNVILRRDFTGAEVSAGAGFFEGKKDYRASVTLGFGDLGANKVNAFGVIDYYKRDLVQFSDTEYQETRDFRGRHEGGRNFQSLTGGGTWRQLSPTNALTNVHRAISACNGRVLTAQEAVSAGLISPVLNNAGFNLAGNTFCSKDFNYAFTAIPGTERVGFLGRGTAEFSASMQGYLELGLSRIETEQKFQEPFFAGTTGLQRIPDPNDPNKFTLRPFTYNINFAPGVAGNPFPTNARYVGVLQDMGTRDTDITSDTFRGIAGLRYSVRGWDLDSAVGYSKNEVEAAFKNRLSIAGVSSVFGVGTGPQPPVPTSNSSSYNLDNFNLNSATVRDLMRANFSRVSESELTFIDTKASTEVGQLPGGPIGVALGIEYRNEKIKDTPAEIAQQGLILGQGITATDGSRHNLAVFGELALPLTRTLELQAALRSDKYSDFGSSLNPKLGAKFKPTNEFLFRVNWGRGFRAPSLPEISDSVATFFTTVADPNFGNQLFQVSGSFAGNPNLNPEKSRSTTVGFVWEPSADFNVGFDWYEINWSNVVIGNCCQAIVNSGDPSRVIRDPATGFITTVIGGWENASRVFTRGFDVDLRYSLRSTIGRFTTRFIGAYVDEYFTDDNPEAGNNSNGTNTIPRIKATLSQEWEQGPWTLQGRINYIHSYEQCLVSSQGCGGPSSFFNPQAPEFQTGTLPRKVPSYTTLDLTARYAMTPKLTITGAVLNVTGELPPFDPAFSGTSLFDFSQYDVRGRQFRVGASYKF